MPQNRRGDLKTRHFFFPRKGVSRETKCGKRNRENDEEIIIVVSFCTDGICCIIE